MGRARFWLPIAYRIQLYADTREALGNPLSLMGERKKTPTEAFGEVLKELRESKGLTQEALALDAGTERSHISALERAEKGPSLGTILRLAQALELPAGDIVSRVEQKLSDKKR